MKRNLLFLGLVLSTGLFAQKATFNIIPGKTVTEINDTLAQSVTAGNTDVTLQFADGGTYFGGTDVINLPAGITKLTLKANVGSNTTVDVKTLSFTNVTAPLTGVFISNLNLVTTSSSTNLIGQTAAAYPQRVEITNCSLKGYRGIYGATSNGKISVLFDNCVFRSIGSYGLVNNGTMLKDVTFSNCTFINMLTIFNNSGWTIDADNPFTLKNCTFYNNASYPIVNLFFRLAANPSAGVTIDKVIVASSVANANNLFYSSTGYNGLNFSTSFMTNSYSTTKLTNIQTFAGTALDLFVDPENDDFTFKSGVAGDVLAAGDPTRSRKVITSISDIYDTNSNVKISRNMIQVTANNPVISLYNTKGQLVLQQNTNTLSTSVLANGIYILKVKAEGKTFAGKVSVSNL